MMPVRVFAEEIRHEFCGFPGEMPAPVQPQTNGSDADQLSKLLEIELIQKRATWKQANERARSIRAVGLIFLCVLIVGCLVGAYFVFMRVNEQRANPSRSSAIDR
jgi:hypothetical protein